MRKLFLVAAFLLTLALTPANAVLSPGSFIVYDAVEVGWPTQTTLPVVWPDPSDSDFGTVEAANQDIVDYCAVHGRMSPTGNNVEWSISLVITSSSGSTTAAANTSTDGRWWVTIPTDHRNPSILVTIATAKYRVNGGNWKTAWPENTYGVRIEEPN